jgi:hypothetical protein
MMHHPSISVFLVFQENEIFLRPLVSYLESLSHLTIDMGSETPSDFAPYDVVVTAETVLYTDWHYSHSPVGGKGRNPGGPGWLNL